MWRTVSPAVIANSRSKHPGAVVGGESVEDGGNRLRNLEGEVDEGRDYGERRRLSVQSITTVGSGECTRECRAGDDQDVIMGTVDSVRDVSIVKEVLRC